MPRGTPITSPARTPFLRLAAAAFLLLSGPLAATGQTTPPPPSSHPPDQAAAPTPPMSREQRKQLLDSVDSMLQFVSTDTALPIRHPVKRKLISREEVTRYLRKRMHDDESTRRLERSEVVLKKFGLLDRSFDLQPFLVSLLTEQIAGFYDNKTKTVNLLDWVDPKEQKPVLAHELTHALQDQTVDLEKWGDSGVHGISKDFADDKRHIATDELETAREAVAEGQAMVVFYDDALRASGKSLADLPDDAPLIDPDSDDADTKGSPVMARAPYLLQQSLLFPYSYGLAFEQTVLRRRGKPAAFADVLASPPSTSYEVMNPRIWLEHGTVPAISLPDLHPLLDPGYTPYDLGVMGELDVRILGHILGGDAAATKLAANWAGGVYYAAQSRSAPAVASPGGLPTSGTASIALVYESRWRTLEAARSFAALYALGLRHQYPGMHRRPADEASSAEQVYTTTEGDVLILASGHAVFVAEGLPAPLARQVAALFATPEGTGPQIQAKVHPLSLGAGTSEPTLTLSHLLLHTAAPPLLNQPSRRRVPHS